MADSSHGGLSIVADDSLPCAVRSEALTVLADTLISAIDFINFVRSFYTPIHAGKMGRAR